MFLEQFQAVTDRHAEVGGGLGIEKDRLVDADHFAVRAEDRAAGAAFVGARVVDQLRRGVADVALRGLRFDLAAGGEFVELAAIRHVAEVTRAGAPDAVGACEQTF